MPPEARTKQQPTDEDKQIAQPCSAAALAEYGALDTPLPAAPFEPDGAGQLSYYIWMSGGPWANYRGRQSLERQPADGGGFTLTVRQDWIFDRQRAVHETIATIHCRGDQLGTPQTWELQSRVYDVKTGEEYTEAAIRQTGRATRDGVEVTTNGSRVKHPLAAPWGSNWSVFEAVQRLPRALAEPMAFTLLEDLDTVKTGHRIYSRGSQAVTFGGQSVTATRYDQIGRGCLPCVYYVDEFGRTVLAHTALRAYILDPKVDETHEQKVKQLANKELR